MFDLGYYLLLFCVLYLFYWKFFGTKHEIIKKEENELIVLNSCKNETRIISLLTYNILCQKFMKRKNRKDLNLENRMDTILHEIKAMNSDIICIQETNWFTYKNYFLKYLNSYFFEYCDNYGSNFINVIGYNYKKFKLNSKTSLDLSSVNVEGNRGVINVVLTEIETKEEFSIYNVHFPWKPTYELEKCLIFNIIAEDVINKGIKKVIISGDFNSIPNSLVLRMVYYKDFLSEINNYTSKCENIKQMVESFKLHSNSFINMNSGNDYHLTLLSESSKAILVNENHKENFKNVFNNFSKLHYNLNFKSAYESYKLHHVQHRNRKGKDKTPSFIKNHAEYSNYTEFFKDNIDYIFYSNKLTLTKILKLPDLFELTREHYLPSAKYPSDHIKLYSEFKY